MSDKKKESDSDEEKMEWYNICFIDAAGLEASILKANMTKEQALYEVKSANKKFGGYLECYAKRASTPPFYQKPEWEWDD